jgi:anti-sigma-K factor RskA
MDLRQIEELLPFYALDAVTEEERKLVEEYLAAHPEARRQVEEMRVTASELPLSVAPVEPPPSAKKALMSRVAADARERERSSARARPAVESQPSRRVARFENFFRAFSLAAAAIAILWVIILNVQVARLQNEISALNNRLAAQSESLDRVIANLPQTNPSSVITVSLKGTEVQPQVQGQLIVDPDSQSAVLVISGLPELEPGRTYQVWLIDGGAPVSAGLLAVDENGQAVFIITSEAAIGSFNSLGISIEPEGGSAAPTGDIIVLSEL